MNDGPTLRGQPTVLEDQAGAAGISHVARVLGCGSAANVSMTRNSTVAAAGVSSTRP